MTLETWFAYMSATLALSIIPGPSVLVIVAHTLSRGLRAAMVCMGGEILGGICLMSVAVLGLGTLLAASSQLFLWVKLAGVIYMGYLGINQILQARAQHVIVDSGIEGMEGRGQFNSFQIGFITALLNPKSLAFYVAFLPLFINSNVSVVPQFVLLIATSASVATLVLLGYAMDVDKTKQKFINSKSQQRLGYAGGADLLGGSLWVAVTR